MGLSSSEVTSGSMSFSFTFSVRSLKSFTSSWSRLLMRALVWLSVEAARSWSLREHHPELSGLPGEGPLHHWARAESISHLALGGKSWPSLLLTSKHQTHLNISWEEKTRVPSFQKMYHECSDSDGQFQKNSDSTCDLGGNSGTQFRAVSLSVGFT